MKTLKQVSDNDRNKQTKEKEELQKNMMKKSKVRSGTQKYDNFNLE